MNSSSSRTCGGLGALEEDIGAGMDGRCGLYCACGDLGHATVVAVGGCEHLRAVLESLEVA